MKRSVLLVLLVLLAVAAVAFAACGSDEPVRPSAVPDEIEMEQALELIRSCHVTGVGGTHAGEMELSLKNGRLITIADPDSEAVWEAAEEASERCGEIELYTE